MESITPDFVDTAANSNSTHRRQFGVKPPFKLKEVWAIRFLLKNSGNIRQLALFDLAIDSKLRGCDLVKIRVRDVSIGGRVLSRASVIQQKTGKPVKFELTKETQEVVESWIAKSHLNHEDYLFTSRLISSPHISTRQYARIVKSWALLIGLNPAEYGTHSLRRTKVTLLYKRTKNLRAIQLLLGHTKLESTVRYLGIKIDDALELSENMDI
jgi:integrase